MATTSSNAKCRRQGWYNSSIIILVEISGASSICARRGSSIINNIKRNQYMVFTGGEKQNVSLQLVGGERPWGSRKR